MTRTGPNPEAPSHGAETRTTMRVAVEQPKCVASGQCVLLSPEVFDQDDNGVVELLDASPGPEHHDDVRESAAVCPAAAIHLTES